MNQLNVEHWFWCGYALERLATECLIKPTSGDVPFHSSALHAPLIDKIKTKSVDWIESVHNDCVRLELAVASETALEIVAAIQSPVNRDWQWLMDQIHNLQNIIRKEAKSKVFFYIPPGRLKFWITKNNPYPLGEDVHNAFPSTHQDAAEAGMCLAVARPTASVFHSMRVLETGLTALGSVFDVSLAHTNWAPAIDEIERKIRDMHKDPKWKALPDCKALQEFYAQAASHFGILKDAWRNYTAHKRGVYTEERAALIYGNLKAFMQTLATTLHE
jgi:hypothetical protein